MVIGNLLVILVLSFLVETLIEFLFGEPLAKFAPKFSWLLKYIAVACAIALTLFYKFDVIYLLGQFVTLDWQPLSDPSVPGMIITGIAVGKGSNYMHDLFKRFFVKPTTPTELP